MEDDRRKTQRKYLIYYLRVFDQNTGNLVGHIVDISPEGVMLISESPIEVDMVFQFRMDLPTDTGKTHADFSARSIWCQRDANPDFYDTGFHLLEIEEGDVSAIEQLIRLYGFNM